MFLFLLLYEDSEVEVLSDLKISCYGYCNTECCPRIIHILPKQVDQLSFKEVFHRIEPGLPLVCDHFLRNKWHQVPRCVNYGFVH